MTTAELRKQVTKALEENWAVGPFIGPCPHGRDPYTRCDTCGVLEPREAYKASIEAPLKKRIQNLEDIIVNLKHEVMTANLKLVGAKNIHRSMIERLFLDQRAYYNGRRYTVVKLTSGGKLGKMRATLQVWGGTAKLSVRLGEFEVVKRWR